MTWEETRDNIADIWGQRFSYYDKYQVRVDKRIIRSDSLASLYIKNSSPMSFAVFSKIPIGDHKSMATKTTSRTKASIAR